MNPVHASIHYSTASNSRFRSAVEEAPPIIDSAGSVASEDFYDAVDAEMPSPIREELDNPSKLQPTDEEEEGKKEGWARDRPIFKCMHQIGQKRPRCFAFFIGLVFPLFLLIGFAMICGYPLAYLESPIELDHNDHVLGQQMKLFLEASLYTNITQQLPRICLALYYQNATTEEFLKNISAIMEGPQKLEVFRRVLDHVEKEEEDLSVELGVEVVLANQSEEIIVQITNETTTTTDDGSATHTNYTTTTTTANHTVGRIELSTPLLSNGIPDIPDTFDASDVNLTEMGQFIVDCGAGLSPIVDQMLRQLFVTLNSAVQGIDFAWSQCPLGNNTTAVQAWFPNENKNSNLDEDAPTGFLWDWLVKNSPLPLEYQDMMDQFKLDPQSGWYRHRWERDRRRLYRKYLREPPRLGFLLDQGGMDSLFVNQTEETESGATSDEDREPSLALKLLAFEQSIEHATGRQGCVAHVPAACWFWFTVMTTIGYGNSSPNTFGGKTLVFTLGFVSILAFGAVSARAAYVISSLLEDFLIRMKARHLLSSWAYTFIWGIITYVWMLVIATYYVWWQQARLGSDGVSDWQTGYWFAYISTTTVGFGDYYLAPEVITMGDLMTFPLMFLVGFSCMAAFLTNLSEGIKKPFRSGKSLVEQFIKADEDAAALRNSRKRIVVNLSSGDDI